MYCPILPTNEELPLVRNTDSVERSISRAEVSIALLSYSIWYFFKALREAVSCLKIFWQKINAEVAGSSDISELEFSYFTKASSFSVCIHLLHLCCWNTSIPT